MAKEESSPSFQEYNPVERAALSGVLKTAVGIENLRKSVKNRWRHATRYDEERKKVIKGLAGAAALAALAAGGLYVKSEIDRPKPITLGKDRYFFWEGKKLFFHNSLTSLDLNVDLPKLNTLLTQEHVPQLASALGFLFNDTSSVTNFNLPDKKSPIFVQNILPVNTAGRLTLEEKQALASARILADIVVIARHPELVGNPSGAQAILTTPNLKSEFEELNTKFSGVDYRDKISFVSFRNRD